MGLSLHERMMRSHGGGEGLGNHTGMPKEIASYDIFFKSKQKVAEGTYSFTFAKPDSFTPKAGQHVRVTLIDPPETDDEGNSRFLSFASSPQEEDLVFAMRMRDTAFKRVFANLRPRDRVLMQMRLGPSPHGSFELKESADAGRPAVFLIGGIGIVPTFSMVKDSLKRRVQSPIYLFYANRRPEDAPFLSDLQALAKKHANFIFVPTMSESEKSSQTWNGETGRITGDLVKKYVKDLQKPIYYIAGLTEMVSAMQKMLKQAGISKDSIRAEEFGAFASAHGSDPNINTWKRFGWAILIGLLAVAIIAVHIIGLAVPHWLLNILAALIFLKIVLFLVFRFKNKQKRSNP
jgi:ferredoxin-NADP reductase